MKQREEEQLMAFVQVIYSSHKERERLSDVIPQYMADMYTSEYLEQGTYWPFVKLKFTPLQLNQVRKFTFMLHNIYLLRRA